MYIAMEVMALGVRHRYVRNYQKVGKIRSFIYGKWP
jgi:hypothetical protein